jgi:hypothetical protein
VAKGHVVRGSFKAGDSLRIAGAFYGPLHYTRLTIVLLCITLSHNR